MPPFHRPNFTIFLLSSCFLLFLTSCGPAPTETPTSISDPIDTQTQLPFVVEDFTQTPFIITTTPETVTANTSSQGEFFMSLEEGGYFHLFAYSPHTLPLTRITSDKWDDITPALSPDGNQLAFSSRRNNYWDLYVLDLNTGAVLRLNDTLEYEAAPSWSPDGAFIAYESYSSGNLDIFVRSVQNLEQAPIRITQSLAADTSPAWSPLGRQIAFISNRSGEPEVWVADLDHAGFFNNVSTNPQMVESHPTWSQDGSKLAWAATDPDSGLTSLYVWDALNPNTPVRWFGSGDWPVWQGINYLASRLTAPNQTYLTGYSTEGTLTIPPFLLPGALRGLSYGISSAAIPGAFQEAAQVTPDIPFAAGTHSQPNNPPTRSSLATLNNVTAPYPQLNEIVSISFQLLRDHVTALAGWDALSKLENAFVPLTTPLDPGLGEDWLFTGRAITLNPALIQANWMAVVREDFGQQVYWRIYLRTAAQDGSQGMPISQVPWDFSARTTSSTAYENGGRLMNSIPKGYWLDLTALASQYGWERLPALSNWRSYYAGARFNELVFPEGLGWHAAMLQLYPPEVLITPTIVIPPTRTPTRTPLWYTSPTPTHTPSAYPTSTFTP